MRVPTGVRKAVRFLFAVGIYLAMGVVLCQEVVKAIETEMDQRLKSSVEAKFLARELALEGAVDNPVELLSVSVSK